MLRPLRVRHLGMVAWGGEWGNLAPVIQASKHPHIYHWLLDRQMYGTNSQMMFERLQDVLSVSLVFP